MSICGIEGCRFESYYPPFLKKVTFFNKNKIKKKNFKKNPTLIKKISRVNCGLILYKCLSIYSNYIKHLQTIKTENVSVCQNTTICISQKLYNPKATIVINKNLNTFSVGSIIKYFKIKQGKFVRRSLKGLKVFINFLKNIFLKKYAPLQGSSKNCMILNIIGFDYNLLSVKTNLKNFFKDCEYKQLYFLFNIKISFTKVRGKRVKSIKKRLKKKILSVFLKGNKI